MTEFYFATVLSFLHFFSLFAVGKQPHGTTGEVLSELYLHSDLRTREGYQYPFELFFILVFYLHSEFNIYIYFFLLQMAITSERLHKQSVVIKQICKLFPQRRVSTLIIDFS